MRRRGTVKIAAGILAGATALYLFTVLAFKPVRPPFLFLQPAREETDRFWERMENRSLLLGSRRRAIAEYLAEIGGAAVQGFSRLNASTDSVYDIQSYTWPTTFRKTRSWLVRTRQSNQSVSWFTGASPEQRTTTFLFSAAINSIGEAELLVVGEPILIFNTNPEERPKTWEENGFVLRFFPLARFIHESGIFCLTVPGEKITAGQPLLIEVRSVSGINNHSFFALHDQRDTRELVLGPGGPE